MAKERLSKEEVLGRLSPIFERRFNIGGLKPEYRFKEDLGAEPVEILELVAEIETEFGIGIPDKEIGELKDVNDFVLEILGRIN